MVLTCTCGVQVLNKVRYIVGQAQEMLLECALTDLATIFATQEDLSRTRSAQRFSLYTTLQYECGQTRPHQVAWCHPAWTVVSLPGGNFAKHPVHPLARAETHHDEKSVDSEPR